MGCASTLLLCLNMAVMVTAIRLPFDQAAHRAALEGVRPYDAIAKLVSTVQQYGDTIDGSFIFQALQSESCTMALAALSENSTADCLAQYHGFDTLQDPESATAFCVGNNSCRAILASTNSNLRKMCTPEELTWSLAYDQSIFMSIADIICAQHDGQLCTPTIAKVVSDVVNFTVESLDLHCSPCGRQFYQQIQNSMGSSSDDYFLRVHVEGLCLKVDNEYCAPRLHDLFLANDTSEILEGFCDPCFKAFVPYTSANISAGAIDRICSADSGNGKTCAFKLGEVLENSAPEQLSGCDVDNSTNSIVCNDSCKAYINYLVLELECCAHDFSTVFPGDSACGIVLPEACTAPKSGFISTHPNTAFTAALMVLILIFKF